MIESAGVLRRAAAAALLALVFLVPGVPRRAGAQADAYAALVTAAKAEGSVFVDGPPIDPVRTALSQGFEDAFGIRVSYISSGSTQSGARVRAERAAGRYLLDVFISGSDTPTLTFLPNGWLDKIEPVLIAPDVVDRRRWKDGHLWYMDAGHVILRTLRYVTPELAINTKLVTPRDVRSWKSLLDPKWHGKIVAKDPSISGAGSFLIGYFYVNFGPDFVKSLYRDQEPIISRDARQAAQWIAQGNNPILLGPDIAQISQFQKLGFPVAIVFPADGPSVLSGGWGLISLVNKAPHPNAAKLFVNWIAGKAGQEALAHSTFGVSLRTDVTYDAAFPPFLFPQKGQKYLDTYDFTFVTELRDPAFEKARVLLGL